MARLVGRRRNSLLHGLVMFTTLIAASLLFIEADGISSPSAQAAAGTPTVPSPPKLVFHESFEVGQGVNATKLANYVGINGQTHTADPFWLRYDQCNGVLMRYEMPHITGEYCEVGGRDTREARNNTRRLADVLGQLEAGIVGSTISATPVNASNATTKLNHAVTAFTHTVNGPSNAVMIRTSPLNIGADETRFYVASVDVAELSCTHMGGVNNSALRFSFLTGASEWNITSSAIRACQAPNVRYYDSPWLDGGWFYGGNYVAAGTFHTDGSALLTPAQMLGLQVQMRNEIGATDGNDSAFDNIRIYDATPQLDKSFSPSEVRVGEASRLTLTVTNTTDLAEKAGWSFTDTLPSGLVIANNPNVASTCHATVTAPSGGSAVTVADGVLDKGEAFCEVSVDVTSLTAGDYTNDSSNITSRTGVLPPDPATVTFIPLPKLELAKTSGGSTSSRVGDTVTYTVEATNIGAGDFTTANPAVVIDDLSGVLDDAEAPQNITASIGGSPVTAPSYQQPLIAWSGALASGESVVITYTVKLKAGGDRLVENIAFPSEPPFDPQNPPVTPECGVDGAVCTDFPLPLFGSLTWEKTSAAPQSELLTGSEWSLVPLDSNGVEIPAEAVAVVDCVEASMADCTGADVNPAAGELKLVDLELGTYHLHETRAPVGYRLLTTPVVVTLDEASLDAQGALSLGAIENEMQGVPVIPLTGGESEQSYLFAGGAAALLALLLIALRLRKKILPLT